MFQFEFQEASTYTSEVNNKLESSGEQDFHLGQRVVLEKHTGVVRYVGPVVGYAGNWLGVEWDDVLRGKHNGTVDGVKYFQCLNSVSPTSASFVRAEKIRRTNNIITALNKRYGCVYNERVMPELKQISDNIDSIKIIYSQLNLLDLSSRDIDDLGKPNELAKLCPNIRYLCLADNFLRSWIDLVELCRLFDLKRLDVSENQIEPSEDLDKYFNSFPTLEHVILGNMGYDWSAVMKVSSLWPQVTNLQLQYNKISCLSSPLPTVSNLTQLDLGGNLLSSWEEILKLNVLRNLEYLNLLKNRIHLISFPVEDPNDSANRTSFFPNLARLNITENGIEDWNSVKELNKLQNLRELRIELNPFLEGDTRANNRHLIIAYIGKLEKLEGADINNNERRDAELDYIKKYFIPGDLQNTPNNHPRYFDLVKKYGDIEQNQITSDGNTTNKTDILNLEFIPDDSSLTPQRKQVYPEMTVRKLRLLVKKLYGKKNSLAKIEVRSFRNHSIRFELKNDFLTLHQMSVEDSDTLFISWSSPNKPDKTYKQVSIASPSRPAENVKPKQLPNETQSHPAENDRLKQTPLETLPQPNENGKAKQSPVETPSEQQSDDDFDQFSEFSSFQGAPGVQMDISEENHVENPYDSLVKGLFQSECITPSDSDQACRKYTMTIDSEIYENSRNILSWTHIQNFENSHCLMFKWLNSTAHQRLLKCLNISRASTVIYSTKWGDIEVPKFAASLLDTPLQPEPLKPSVPLPSELEEFQSHKQSGTDGSSPSTF